MKFKVSVENGKPCIDAIDAKEFLSHVDEDDKRVELRFYKTEYLKGKQAYSLLYVRHEEDNSLTCELNEVTWAKTPEGETPESVIYRILENLSRQFADSGNTYIHRVVTQFFVQSHAKITEILKNGLC